MLTTHFFEKHRFFYDKRFNVACNPANTIDEPTTLLVYMLLTSFGHG
jgi:hypothetical protein